METAYYLEQFQRAVDTLDLKAFVDQQLELKVAVWFDSVVLKLQKPSWRNIGAEPFKDGVFFSVWISDGTLAENRLHYNIHALKLRELEGYRIKSRDFADGFRAQFKVFEGQWPNVSTAFGPLTLMEGWVEFDVDHLSMDLKRLADKFLDIAFIIAGLLVERRM